MCSRFPKQSAAQGLDLDSVQPLSRLRRFLHQFLPVKTKVNSEIHSEKLHPLSALYASVGHRRSMKNQIRCHAMVTVPVSFRTFPELSQGASTVLHRRGREPEGLGEVGFQLAEQSLALPHF